MVETLAELPFIGEQVGLFRAQPGRPKCRMKRSRRFPGLAITITVLAFNLLGDGICDILDPRLRGAVTAR